MNAISKGLLTETIRHLVSEVVLLESKTDTIAKKIMQRVMTVISSNSITWIDKNGKERPGFSVDAPELEYMNVPRVSVGFSTRNTEKDDVQVSGLVDEQGPGDPVVIQIVFHIHPEHLHDKKLLSKIYAKLLPVLRHEIEHAAELHKSIPAFYKSSNTFGNEYEKEFEDDTTLQRPFRQGSFPPESEYWLRPVEIRAQVIEFWTAAKNQRRSFVDVLQDRVETLRKYAEEWKGNTPERVEKFLNRFQDDIWIYAEQRLHIQRPTSL